MLNSIFNREKNNKEKNKIIKVYIPEGIRKIIKLYMDNKTCSDITGHSLNNLSSEEKLQIKVCEKMIPRFPYNYTINTFGVVDYDNDCLAFNIKPNIYNDYNSIPFEETLSQLESRILNAIDLCKKNK